VEHELRQNYIGHSNRSTTGSPKMLRATVDEAKFLDLVKQGVKILTDDAVVLPLFRRTCHRLRTT
jgi:hypothetical protein